LKVATASVSEVTVTESAKMLTNLNLGEKPDNPEKPVPVMVTVSLVVLVRLATVSRESDVLKLHSPFCP
jgi:hypothetical protein